MLLLVLIAVGFAIAEGRTGIEILRASRAFRSALIRCGEAPSTRNPLDPKIFTQDLKQTLKLFRPRADLEKLKTPESELSKRGKRGFC
jgi:hypothetical protein